MNGQELLQLIVIVGMAVAGLSYAIAKYVAMPLSEIRIPRLLVWLLDAIAVVGLAIYAGVELTVENTWTYVAVYLATVITSFVAYLVLIKRERTDMTPQQFMRDRNGKG